MQNNIVRAFVLVLAIAGFSASSMNSSAKTSSAAVSASVVSTPTPLCAPGSTCGID